MRAMVFLILAPTLAGLGTVLHGGADDANPVDAAFVEPIPPIPASAEMHPVSPSSDGPPTAPLASVAVPRERAASGLAFPIEAVTEPGTDGRIWLTYGEKADPPALQNPFDCRLAAKSGASTELHVTSVSLGARPVAVVNGRTLALGQRVEAFNLVHLERGAVFFEKNGRVLRVPVGQRVTVAEGRER